MEKTECPEAIFDDGDKKKTDLTLTLSHFQTLPELAKWWSLISDSIQQQSNTDDTNGASSGAPRLIDDDAAPWLPEFRTTIRNILQSRNIGDQHRRMALTLAASMTSTFGTSWLGGDSKFLQLLASLAAIDVRMILDREETPAAVDGEASGGSDSDSDEMYLARCCGLLETALECAASVEEERDEDNEDRGAVGDTTLTLTAEQALQINDTLMQLTEFLLEYLAVVKEKNIQIPRLVSYPLYRLVCAYLAQGLALIREDNLTSSAESLLDLNRKIMADLNDAQFDSTRLILPVLSELIELDEKWNGVKTAYKRAGVLNLIEDYIQRNNKSDHSEDDQRLLELWKNL